MNLSLHKAFPVGVFVIGLVAALLFALKLHDINDDRLDERFAVSADMAIATIEDRIDAQVTVLRGTAGLFHSSDAVTARDFHTFIERLDLEANYRGVPGVGFAAVAPTREALESMARTLDPGREVEVEAWPLGERNEYSSLLYFEPYTESSRQVLGYDMLGEEVRRAAMSRAARTGEAVISARVHLGAEGTLDVPQGFVIFTPVYARGAEQSEAAIYGWVFSPLIVEDLFREVFPSNQSADLAVSIYDGSPEPENLLFRSSDGPGDHRYSEMRNLETAGHEWTVAVTALPPFAQGINSLLPWVVGLGGALVSLLLAMLSYQQVRAAGRVDQQVKLRTAELKAANTRLREEVAARARAESEVLQMRRVESLGQLTGGIAHDFNNMLAVVMGNLELAKANIDNPERLEKLIYRAIVGALRAADLTQRLLAFARRQPLAPTRVDVNLLVRDMSEMLDRTIGKHVSFRTELAGDLWPALVDSNQLENALLNLVINARDAMKDGDALVIRTSNEMRAIGEEADGEPVECVCIMVRDTGSGMSPEVRDQALEPFFTTKGFGKGTGLGLSQVFGFVRQSGGDLEIETAENEGTTIRMFLPRLQGAEAGDPADADAPVDDVVGGLPQEVVLVVDDEDGVRTMTVEMLRGLGYTVIGASGGEEALRKLAAHPEIRVVVSDVIMPEMSGTEFAHHALSAVPDLKFVLVSGYDNLVEPPRQVKDGVVARLHKPFSREQLAHAIRKAFDRNADIAWPRSADGQPPDVLAG